MNDKKKKRIIECLKDIAEINEQLKESFKILPKDMRDEFNSSNKAARSTFIAEHTELLYKKFKFEYFEETKLNDIDESFIAISTGLQILRQYLIGNKVNHYLSENNKIDKLERKLFGPVPYDCQDACLGMGGPKHHRLKSLGHDPILGLIVGPINILTDTITKNDFTTYKLYYNGSAYHCPGNVPVPTTLIGSALYAASNYSIQDWLKALVHHLFHIASDLFTKESLQLPCLSVLVGEDEVAFLNKMGINSYTVARGATLSTIIDIMISFLYKVICYCSNKEKEMTTCEEVKLKKILLLSNGIATTSNIGIVALTENYKILDVGGILKFTKQLFTEKENIEELRRKIINEKFDNFSLQ